jgi:ABC-2 type transport system ATP-binding protein
MSEEYAVIVDNVSICFNLSKEVIQSLKEYIMKFLNGSLLFEEFWALSNVSVKIKKGEIIGIVGYNGAGKSTLLKVIAGVLKPTKGSVSVHGSMAPLIELGAGFDYDLTARENIFLNGAVLGYSHKFMESKFQEVLDFSELHEFVDVPVKNYSTGMVARLGFAVSTIIKPDILIVDEILGVGDYKFQEKCKIRINELLAEGTTVIMVSHSHNQIEEFCKRAIWLEKGIVKDIGPAKEICQKYINS